MKKLLNKNEDSGDVRHKAKITEQQQQHLEELKKLQESFKEKQGDISAKPKSKDDAKQDQVPEQAKKVNVSRKANIFKIITEKFVIAVQPKHWDKIISGLRRLFWLNDEEVVLQAEIKRNNKTISSFLAKLKGKDLETEIKIAALLRQIAQNPSFPSAVNASRLLAIQTEIIANLTKTQSVNLQRQFVEKNQAQDMQAQAERSAKINAEQQNLHKIKSLAKEFSNEKVTSTSQALQQFKIQDLNQLQSRYIVRDVSSAMQPQKPVDILRPIEQALNFAKDMAEKHIIAPIKLLAKEITADFQNLFKASHHHHSGDKNCSNYPQQKQQNMHNHKGKHVHGHGCGCCPSDEAYNIRITTFQSTKMQDVHMELHQHSGILHSH